MEANGPTSTTERPAGVIDTVYALHDFAAENPDELSFKSGEKIDVVEKDDQYGDGWWQGRNSAGEFGLFPQSYTSPNPPTKPAVEAKGDQSAPSGVVTAVDTDAGTVTSSTVPDAVTAKSSDAPSADSGGSGLHDTLSEVQNAIDQMGRGGRIDSGSPLASPAQLRDRSHTFGSLDSVSESEDEGKWDQQGAEEASTTRARLAQKAKAQNMARTASARGSAQSHDLTNGAGIELSDESDDEEHAIPAVSVDRPASHELAGASLPASQATPRPTSQSEGTFAATADPDVGASTTRTSRGLPDAIANADGSVFSREYLSPGGPPNRGRADSDVEPTNRSVSDGASEYEREIGDYDDADGARPFAAAARAFGVSSSPPAPPPVAVAAPVPPPVQAPTAGPVEASEPAPSSSAPHVFDHARPGEQNGVGVTPVPDTSKDAAPASHEGAPIAAAIGAGAAGAAAATAYEAHRRTASGISGASSGVAARGPAPGSSRASSVVQPSQSGITASTSPSTPHPDDVADPSEWDVDQVIEWGRSKHLDDFTLSKFAEHEITGDVLLELDLNTLKEIDLTAFGRRVKVHKAITELKKSVTAASSAAVAGGPSTPVSPTSSSHPPSGYNFTPTSGQFATYRDDPTAASASASPQATREAAGFSPQTTYGTPGQLPMTPESPPAVGDQYSPGLAQSLGMTSPTIHSKDDAAKVVSPTATMPLAGKAVELKGLGLTSEAAAGGIVAPIELPDQRPELSSAPMASKRTSDTVESFKSASTGQEGEVNGASSSPDAATLKSAAGAQPPSPETGKADSIKGKGSRTSFLGSLRNRKPPPRVPAPGIPENEVETKASPSTSPILNRSTGSPSHHRLSTRIFPFHLPHSDQAASLRSSTSSSRVRTKPIISSPLQPEEAAALKSSTATTNGVSSPASSEAASPALGGLAPRTGARPPPRSPSMPFGGSTGAAKFAKPPGPAAPPVKQKTAAEMIGTPDHSGWMRKKGDQYPSWKMRYFVLKGTNLYYLKSETETKIKGHIRLPGYRVIMHGDVNPGRYGFKIVHDSHGSHSFSSEDSKVIREWAKAIMKAIIERDWKVPVVTTCSVEVMDIREAQQMFPPPRPPSPTSRSRMAKARPAELSQQDAQKLMGIAPTTSTAVAPPSAPAAPPKSARRTMPEAPGRRSSLPPSSLPSSPTSPTSPKPPVPAGDAELLDWVNSNLPPADKGQAVDLRKSFRDGKLVTRLVEHLSGSSSGLGDAAFASFSETEPLKNIETHFEVFDYLNSQRIPLQVCSLNDLINGQPDRTAALVQSVRQQLA